MKTPSCYDSTRMAAAYAYSRPPVDAKIVEHVRDRLEEMGIPPAHLGLDVGCGAGLSTAALQLLATAVVGVEPVQAMLAHSRDVAPGARFVAGCAEHLPFSARCFDVITAAGSLNYADQALALVELWRVLADRGVIVIYDFGPGRRLAGDARLDRWFASFEQRYPWPSGSDMDVRRLDFDKARLRLAAAEDLQVTIPLTSDAYLAYVLSETNVEQAIANGVHETEIREWCARGLRPIFAGAARDVQFDASIAYVRPVS